MKLRDHQSLRAVYRIILLFFSGFSRAFQQIFFFSIRFIFNTISVNCYIFYVIFKTFVLLNTVIFNVLKSCTMFSFRGFTSKMVIALNIFHIKRNCANQFQKDPHLRFDVFYRPLSFSYMKWGLHSISFLINGKVHTHQKQIWDGQINIHRWSLKWNQ